MAFASPLPLNSRSGSRLGRTLKAAFTGLALTAGMLVLSACNTTGSIIGDGGQPVAENGGPARGPRPDVNPIGPEGPVATGGPRIGSGVGAGPLKVALLVPQSGRARDQLALGNALFDAAQMALFDTGRSDITLIVKDTGAGSAASAAQQAISEGAEIIIGPVFAEEVGAVRAVAAPMGVPVIAFSSDNSVAGGGAYLLSFPPEEEIRAVVNYAAGRGVGLFAVLAPQNAYGRRAANAFARDVASIGGAVVADVSYPAVKEAMYPSVMQLDGKDFDALFIPDGGANLRDIAGMVRFGPPPPPAPKPLTEEQIAAGVAPPPPPPPPVRAVLPEHILLGTGLWDEAANGASGGLARGVFAAPEPSARQSFSARFEGAYGYRPPRVASLGYDALALAATLSSDMPGRRFSAGAITDPNGFNGVDGIFRFLPNGTIQRGLAIIEANGGGFSVLRPAARTFQAAGY